MGQWLFSLHPEVSSSEDLPGVRKVFWGKYSTGEAACQLYEGSGPIPVQSLIPRGPDNIFGRIPGRVGIGSNG